MRTKTDRIARTLLPVALGAVLTFAAMDGWSTITAMAHATPHVGDIITFEGSGSAVSLPEEQRVVVTRSDQGACVLDLATLRHLGGSLVIESQIAGDSGAFHVHFAGKRTADDYGDCGATADLVADGNDLTSVAASAGGYMAGPKHESSYSGDPAI